VIVGSILIADGFLACRYLQKRENALNGGCPENCIASLAKSVQPTSPATTPAMAVPPSGSPLGATYQHGALELSFKYPTKWGSVSIEEEQGSTTDGSNTIVGLMLSLDKFSTQESPAIFLHANNSTVESVSRATEYWGIEAEQIFSDAVIESWCDGRDNCSIFVNSQGLLIARVESEVSAEDGATRTVHEYYLFNPESGYGGVVLSNRYLAERNVDDYAGLFAQLVDSVAPLSN